MASEDDLTKHIHAVYEEAQSKAYEEASQTLQWGIRGGHDVHDSNDRAVNVRKAYTQTHNEWLKSALEQAKQGEVTISTLKPPDILEFSLPSSIPEWRPPKEGERKGFGYVRPLKGPRDFHVLLIADGSCELKYWL